MMFRDKRILILLCLALFGQEVMAQSGIARQWINPSQSYLKLKVGQDGLHRINHDVFASGLLSVGEDVTLFDVRRLQLYFLGEEQAIFIADKNNNNRLEAGEFIEFYGEGLKGVHERGWLYSNSSDIIQRDESIIGDTSAYFLTWGLGTSNLRVDSVENDLTSLPSEEPYCLFTHSTLKTNGYNGGPLFGEIYDSEYSHGEGFTDRAVIQVGLNRNYKIKSDRRYTGFAAPNAIFKTKVLGISTGSHNLNVKFNGTDVYSKTYFGYKLESTGGISIPVSSLANNNTIQYQSLGLSGIDNQRFAWAYLTYARQFHFGGARSAKFAVTGNPGSKKYFRINGFNRGAGEPILWDRDNNIRMVGRFFSSRIHFHVEHGSDTVNYFMSSPDSNHLVRIERLIPAPMRNFSDSINQASFLLITHEDLNRNYLGTNWIEEYADYKRSSSGGGHDLIVINIDELENEFGYGIPHHPIALRNFGRYALDSFSKDANFLFIIGKGYSYAMVKNKTVYEENLVSTWGLPGADNLLVSPRNTIDQGMAVGRLAAATPIHVRDYLNKVRAFDDVQATAGQTVEEKFWMKKSLHFAGGANTGEQDLFLNNYLKDYEDVIEDSLYGSNISTFKKLSSGVTETALSKVLDSFISNGVMLMTHFGHAAAGTLDFNFPEPEDFNNSEKLPLIIINGCGAGAIFFTTSVSEDYVLQPNEGAIGFVATTSLAQASGLDKFTDFWYRQISRTGYGEPIGNAFQAASQHVNVTSGSISDRAVAQQMCLHGDPSLILYAHDEPDYAIEPQFVQFNPPIVTVADDSFDVQVIVHNLGRAVNDSFEVELKRIFPDGNEISQVQLIPSTKYNDTLNFSWETDRFSGLGANKFEVRVDAANSAPEKPGFEVVNNQLVGANAVNLLILADDLIPVVPQNYGIVGDASITLKASTANAFAEERDYLIEIDTTKNFNSPLKLRQNFSQAGGVVEWDVPLGLSDSTVYYWRCAPDVAGAKNWRYSSFIYIPSKGPGWNQSHFFQYKENSYDDIFLPNSRKFRFTNNFKSYKIETGIYPHVHWSEINSYINEAKVQTWMCSGVTLQGGFIVFVIDSVTGDPWIQDPASVSTYPRGRYGDIICGGGLPNFSFITNSPSDRALFANFLNDSIPSGAHVFLYGIQNPRYADWATDVGNPLGTAFASTGATGHTSLAASPDLKPYILYFQKGNIGTVYEEIGDSLESEISHTISIAGRWTSGTHFSNVIGPAANWQDLQWSFADGPDPFLIDKRSIDVFGYDWNQNLIDTLATNLKSGDTTLSWIDPNTHPFISLSLHQEDDSFRTPGQLHYWRVLYEGVPEAALNPQIHWSMTNDTVQEGQELEFEVTVSNIDDYDMDSLLIDYTLIDRNNVTHNILSPKERPLLVGDTLLSKIKINTIGREGMNTLFVDVNPAFAQPEQTRVNNLGFVQFFVKKDLENPLLDVTFDGRHIMDGEIVSAEPAIKIKLKDENRWLALGDTSVLQLLIKKPDGVFWDVHYDNPALTFIPADTMSLSSMNEAELHLNTHFEQDGVYELIVRSSDASGNAPDLEYRIHFEVINESLVSNLLPYPNPFSTSTQFIFTLTGSEVPDYFKIQILTLSGKVVKEIDQSELGSLNIGLNKTSYTWDGRDDHGDLLANGLYLYRVEARSNAERLELYESSSDKYFKNGIGKIYIAR